MEQPLVSVIIPVRNAEDTLAECLFFLKQSTYPNMEIIVVNDHSSDGSVEKAIGAGVCVTDLEDGCGVSAARNAGALAAQGDILLFTDADVMFQPHTVAAIVECMNDPSVHGTVGLQGLDISFRNFCSQWKNLWMRYTYERLPDRIALFYTSVAAIRAETFRESGGFDENYARPSVEDTEFGRRLAARNIAIKLCRRAEVLHHKYYSMPSLLRTDFQRASALVRLTLRERAERKAKPNAPHISDQKFSVPAGHVAGAFLFTAGLGFAAGAVLSNNCVFAWPAAAAGIAAVITALPFFKFVSVRHGIQFLFPALPFWALDSVAMTAGAAWGALGFFVGKKY